MEFYYNETCLVNNLDHLIQNIKEIKALDNLVKSYGYNLYIKNNLDINYRELDIKKFGAALSLLSSIKKIASDDYEMILENEVIPNVTNYYFLELLGICYIKNNNLIVSSQKESINIENNYQINKNSKNINIENLIGLGNLHNYMIHKPSPRSISETFERIELNFNGLKFTPKSYASALEREGVYKNYGFGKIIDVFKVVHELLLPFYRGNMEGVSQSDIEFEFKRLTNGIEFSHESKETMKKYGEKRSVMINGVKIYMSFHIKLTLDSRIYFKYINDEDCIYFGHCGKHLRIASN